PRLSAPTRCDRTVAETAIGAIERLPRSPPAPTGTGYVDMLVTAPVGDRLSVLPMPARSKRRFARWRALRGDAAGSGAERRSFAVGGNLAAISVEPAQLGRPFTILRKNQPRKILRSTTRFLTGKNDVPGRHRGAR